MSEVKSALPGAESGGVVRVEEAGLVGMVLIRGDLAGASFKAAVTDVTGAELPGPRQRTTIGDNALLWMSPDELMLTCPHEAAPGMAKRLGEALSGQHHLAADVSDARAVFRLAGEGGRIRDTLAKLTPADLRPGVLPVGEVRRSRLAQVPAAFWFEAEDAATVVCFRSVAHYVFGLLANAASPGAEVGHFS